jgi:hypothetical protein
MKLPLSSHTHLHQPLATEGASLERKGNEWWVIPKYLTPFIKTNKLLNSLFQRLGNTTEEDLTYLMLS